jgi:UDP-N-acetylglucosamine 2-epimerase (non-hydrolysing)
MSEIVVLLKDLATNWHLLFVMHAPTLKQLERFGLLASLEDSDIKILPMQAYPSFINLLHGATFVMTDGGSIQEECAFLDIPCLILRKKTERADGIGRNATLSKFNHDIISIFINDLGGKKKKQTFTYRLPHGPLGGSFVELGMNRNVE